MPNPVVRILLVDDDEDVRETSTDILEEFGYRVEKAPNGFEALEALERIPGIDLMVSDIRMPGMSGLELAAIVQQRWPGLKIILVSGYFTPQKIQLRFLQKPFRASDLDAAIRAELQPHPVRQSERRSLECAAPPLPLGHIQD